MAARTPPASSSACSTGPGKEKQDATVSYGPKDALITALALLATLTVTVSVVFGVRLYRRSRAKREVKETILVRKS
jgi:hypothetical protein